MKTKHHLLFALTSAALFGITCPAWPQDQVPPIPPVPPVPPVEPAPPRPLAPGIKPLLDDVRRQVDVAREQAERAFSEAGDVFSSFVEADANFPFRPVGRPARSLIIPTSDMGAEALTTAEEDLNIMARILEKALPGRSDDKPERRAMGIAISSMPGGGGAVRNLYLEGYGAVFFLDVRFPLLPPPKKEEQAKPKEPTSSAWEEARSELYSPRESRGDNTARIWDARKGAPLDASEEYDTDKVEQLKESLLDAMKNATHVRNIKPEEAVTLVINGGETSHTEVRRLGPDGDSRVTPKPGAKRRTEVYSVNATGFLRYRGGRNTTMTIQTKKSDVDAFAQGKIDLQQFKKSATIRVY